jgi:hypothetical protein
VLFFQQHAASWTIVFFFKKKGTNSSIVFDDKENCDQEDKKIIAFLHVDFSQLNGAHTDDDHTWLRQNDSYVPMFVVTQPTNSYVCNLPISLGEIPNLCQDSRPPFKRIRGENANNLGKLMGLIRAFISSAHIVFSI